jgi:hypothetical protein
MHFCDQILRPERPREIVAAVFENGDAVLLAVVVADLENFGPGECLFRAAGDAVIEVVEIDDHDIGPLGRQPLQGGPRGGDDLAAARLQDRSQQSLQLNFIAQGQDERPWPRSARVHAVARTEGETTTFQTLL